MDKIKLHGLGNNGNFNFYIFDKKRRVYFHLEKIFRDIFKVHLEFYDENNKKINIEKYRDHHMSGFASNLGKPRIDIFYGDRKMFITILCSPQLRLKFNKELFKISEMSKLTKIKTKGSKR